MNVVHRRIKIRRTADFDKKFVASSLFLQLPSETPGQLEKFRQLMFISLVELFAELMQQGFSVDYLPESSTARALDQ